MDIVFFDLETTGVDCCKDKIVSTACQKLNSDWEPLEPMKTMLLNPGIPIPPEATAVHGITNEMVADKPSFAQIQKALWTYFEGCAVAGFNILNFDVPMLSEEYSRVERTWPIPKTIFLDAYKIFIQKERRDLAGAAKFYLEKDHEEAHDAAGDVNMTIEVFGAQIKRYPDLQELSLEELHTFCVGKDSVDLAGKFVRTEDGKVQFAFGKYIRETVNIFHRTHVGFLEWMLKPEQSFPADTRRVAKTLLNGFKP